MADSKSYHEGHRQRMRERMKQASLTSFADHELLEMLLYYTNARRDTNDTAHALIEAFGSLSPLLEAESTHLCNVSGVGEKSAELLMLVGELSRRYALEKMDARERGTAPLDSPRRIVDYLLPKFFGAIKELFYVLLLDNNLRPLDLFPVGNGTVSSVPLSIRQIAERAFAKHAAAVVLAHNHPRGPAVPSADDIALTHNIKEALALLEIPLLEHFILSDHSYACILQQVEPRSDAAQAASPIFDDIKTKFNALKGDR